MDGVTAAPVTYLRPGAQLRLGDVVLGFALRSRSPRSVTIESPDGMPAPELSSSEAAIRGALGAIMLAPRELELVIALVARRCTLAPELAYVRGSDLAPTLASTRSRPTTRTCASWSCACARSCARSAAAA